MRICMFTNTYLPHVGGVARSAAQFTEDLKKMGHEVLMIAPEFEGEAENDPAETLRVPAVQNFNGSDFSVRIPLPFVISERLESFQPEIIHSHHPYLLGDAALRAARQRLVPLIFTHHTLYEKYTHYVPLNSEAMQRLAIHLSTEYANLCNHIIAPSASVADLLKRRGVVKPIWEIPTGVDARAFKNGDGPRFRRARQIPEKARVIGHLGRLAPEKNLPYLTEAVLKYLATDESAVFLVVGGGPSEADVKQAFADRGLADRLILAGKKSGRDLVDAYHAMDLFVFASLSETQGMVLTEAMAAGKAVVALDASGAREVVNDGENGRLLPQDTDSETFAEAIGDFFQAPKRAEAWEKAALSTAEAFDRRVCAEKLVELYQRAAGEPATAKQKTGEISSGWNALLNRLRAEWELVNEKTTAAVSAVQKDGSVDVVLK